MVTCPLIWRGYGVPEPRISCTTPESLLESGDVVVNGPISGALFLEVLGIVMVVLAGVDKLEGPSAGNLVHELHDHHANIFVFDREARREGGLLRCRAVVIIGVAP